MSIRRILSVVGAGVLLGAAVPATATADCGCWHYVRADGPTENATLREVAAPSFDTALAAGGRGGMPLLARWNGVRWRETPLPVPQDTLLEGVAASSTRDAWAVGHTRDGTPQAVHWAGRRSWRAVAVPSREPAFPRAVDARSADDAWIVGGRGRPDTRAAAWHWDGRSWRAVPVDGRPGPPAAGRSEFVAVSALASDDVWAVGSHWSAADRRADTFRTGGPDRGAVPQAFPRAFIAHWDGESWTRAEGPPAPERSAAQRTESVLSDVVALAPDDVWAVGTSWPGADVPLAWHWNGTSWETTFIPWVQGRLHSVAGDGRGGVWAAGESSAGAAMLAHWNGERWDLSGAPTPGAPEPGEGTTGGQGPGAIWGLAHARGTSYLWAVGAYARPAKGEPVRHLITWTNAPRHR